MKAISAVVGVAFALLVGALIVGRSVPQRQAALARAEQRAVTLRETFKRYASLCAGHGPLGAIEFGRIRSILMRV